MGGPASAEITKKLPVLEAVPYGIYALMRLINDRVVLLVFYGEGGEWGGGFCFFPDD